MRILKYRGKLVEERCHSLEGPRVVFLHYVKEEDMPKCKCGEPIDYEISIIEGCPNWDSDIKGVETLDNS